MVRSRPKQLPNGGRGRPKGARNKTTALLKEAILLAAASIGEDGQGKDGLVGYLTTQAKENPGPFMALLGKVLPLQVAGDKENPVVTEIVIRGVSKVQRDAAVAAASRADR